MDKKKTWTIVFLFLLVLPSEFAIDIQYKELQSGTEFSQLNFLNRLFYNLPKQTILDGKDYDCSTQIASAPFIATQSSDSFVLDRLPSGTDWARVSLVSDGSIKDQGFFKRGVTVIWNNLIVGKIYNYNIFKCVLTNPSSSVSSSSATGQKTDIVIAVTDKPLSVIKGQIFNLKSKIGINSINPNDCGFYGNNFCNLLFELGTVKCPNNNCGILQPQSAISISPTKSECDNNLYFSSESRWVTSGDIVNANFEIKAPPNIGTYGYQVYVYNKCGGRGVAFGDIFNIEVKEGSPPPPENKIFCLTSDKKSCISRIGECNNGEVMYSDKQNCENVLVGNCDVCCSNGQYVLGLKNNTLAIKQVTYSTTKQECLGKGHHIVDNSKCSGLSCGEGITTDNKKLGVGETKEETEKGIPIATQLSMREKELQDVTSKTIVKGICDVDENCLSYTDLEGKTDYVVKCRSTPLIKEMIDIAIKKECSKSVFDIVKFGTGISGAVCSVSFFIPQTIPICIISIAGTASASSGAYALQTGCVINKEQKGEGLCIATKKAGINFFESIGQFVNKNIDTGMEDNTVGIITTIIIGFVLFLLFR